MILNKSNKLNQGHGRISLIAVIIIIVTMTPNRHSLKQNIDNI